jgi:hypothetical protein
MLIWLLHLSDDKLGRSSKVKYPGQTILASKIYYKSAYHRGMLHFLMALKTAMQLLEDNLAIITH